MGRHGVPHGLPQGWGSSARHAPEGNMTQFESMSRMNAYGDIASGKGRADVSGALKGESRKGSYSIGKPRARRRVGSELSANNDKTGGGMFHFM